MSELPDSHPVEVTGVIATLSFDERAALYAKYTQLLRDDAARATPSGWQDMATAPRDGTSVTVCGPASGPPQTAFFDVGGWQVWVYQLTGLQVRGKPTHWMPLPEPPK